MVIQIKHRVSRFEMINANIFHPDKGVPFKTVTHSSDTSCASLFGCLAAVDFTI